jgi:hypothetical protein
MGFLDRLKVLKDPALKEWRDSEEQWARILEIGPSVGPLTDLRLELHYSNQPPQEATTTTLVPRGIEPQVGQDVAYHINPGTGQNTTLVIDWDKPPQYGAPPVDTQAVGEAVVSSMMASPLTTTAAQAADPDYQLAALQRMRDAGQISEADFERKKEDLRRWAEDPQDENDPQVQLARLEQQREAGEVTDAEYNQRKADLDNWVANLKRLQ